MRTVLNRIKQYIRKIITFIRIILNRIKQYIGKIITFLKNHQSIFKAFKWLFAQVFTGVVVAGAIYLSTMFLNDVNSYKDENDILQKINIGLNKTYIDNKLGVPIVEFKEAKFLNSYYLLKHSMVRCVYYNGETIAYFITMKTKKCFFKPLNIFLLSNKYADGLNKYVGEFSYKDLGINPSKIVGNVPANNTAYLYYSESYYGGGPANYSYFVFASYMERDNYNPLAVYGQEFFTSCRQEWNLQKIDKCLKKADFNKARKENKPNTIGVVADRYADEIEVIPCTENLRNYYSLLFNN